MGERVVAGVVHLVISIATVSITRVSKGLRAGLVHLVGITIVGITRVSERPCDG